MIKIILTLTLILSVHLSNENDQNYLKIPLENNAKNNQLVLKGQNEGLVWNEGVVRRCYSCRSRGDLGSCKDPFKVNSTLVEKEKGVEAVPCASGWCSKIIEGGHNDDYGIATERQCLPRGPSDSEERCAKTEWNHKKVYMCFCQGDLCNASTSVRFSYYLAIIMLIPICQRIIVY